MRLFLGLSLLTFALACAPTEQNRVTASLAGAEPASDPAVVLVLGPDRTLCTGALIARNLVLTAKHCVQAPFATAPHDPSDFIVGVGNEFNSVVPIDVLEVRVPPGAYIPGSSASVGEGLEGSDIALLILADFASAEPLLVRSEDAASLEGSTARVVGFGRDEAGTIGSKQGTSVTVLSVDEGTVSTSFAACTGDSGGPLIDSAGAVAGVSSYQRGTCGSGTAHYTRIDRHADLIARALSDAGACTATGAELCDGIDNDCNGEIDETCTELGASCSNDSECERRGLCAETDAGRICTRICDARRPNSGCGEGLYCQNVVACGGLCVPGRAGGSESGSACATDTECASLRCVDPGNGARRCGTACEADTGTCTDGQLCAAGVGQCGACVADGWSGQRGVGETCGENGDCHSLLCTTDQDARYCSRFCDETTTCGQGFHCRLGECVRGESGAVGDGCSVDDDCIPGALCEMRGAVGFCTLECATVTCPADFSCGASGFCEPNQALLGEPCELPGDCISRLCADTSTGSVCTQVCSPEVVCPSGFACLAPGDGSDSVCARPPPLPTEASGCSIGEEQVPFECLFWAALLFLWRRRRTERTSGSGL